MNTNGIPPVIAVLGLGPMGAAIARASAAAGHQVVAWNRTRRTAPELGLPGDVAVADTPVEAVAAAGIVIVCVRDHAASGALLAEIAPAAGDRVVLNVSSGTPEDTVASARDAAGRGIRYVTGAVMVPTPLVGTADCAVLYAGASEDRGALAPVMAALGGTSDVLGDDHAVPAALDLAMLDLYFVGIYTHLHATALAGTFGIDPGRFLPYARSAVATVGESLADLTDAVVRRRYDSGQARLDMCLAFLDRIVQTSRDAGIDPAAAALVRDASARAMARWPGGTDWDVVAEDLLGAPRT
ncbi:MULTISPECIES: NAD(P)-dependent oxidoreductase [Microbacterium]|uniref:NAD(P)-dependent oxidoreductase n=1 Tax=Microbacterium wangchenii TaxID=2541726 RepID=A0ABX5SQW0_9MICO|nr:MULTISPECIES: NAD(P)-binding domain-containing protein [Microbacterium]MCK6068295.1 NAD(P)-binding domain-containing protein [Microbacterium sp. EYE_512]QBR87576.1 NAD(P)-dependent oxidoreductase [Microbacterium wangchenii]TXK15844.1 NAD(P)-dependent oxidoreductase [Microbacterium wangchenii]